MSNFSNNNNKGKGSHDKSSSLLLSGKSMSQRQQRFGENVRKALADAFVRGDVYEPILSRISVTVTEVRMSPDLRQADVFIMPLGGENIPGVLDALVRETPNLRSIIAKKVYSKFVPQLIFRADESFNEAQKIEDLFKRVNSSIDG